MKLIATTIGAGAVVFLLAGDVGATPASSLDKCQNTVKSEAMKFVAGHIKAVVTCLQKVSTRIVALNDVDATRAATTCRSAFRRLANSAYPSKTLEAKMTARISAKCDPFGLGVEHTLADLLGTGAGVPQPLNAENLGAYCARFGGDGAVNTLPEWIDCVVAVNTCAANAAVAAHYPRALEWLPLAQTAMSALVPPPADALSALAAVDGAIDATPNDNKPDIQCGGTNQAATGQTTCWDSSGVVIPCAGTGHDGDVQAGAPLAYVDNGDGTITDLNTRLMWEKKSDDGTLHDKDTRYNWDDAVASHVATLNSTTFAGYSDWRVPNIKELVGLVNFEIPSFGPTVDTAFDTGCMAGCTVTTCSCTQSDDSYWSSTTFPASANQAWFVFFRHGLSNRDTKSNALYVRGVRGGS